MTDNEIIKALECCIKAKYHEDCEEMKCPACTKEGCLYLVRANDWNDGSVEHYKDVLDIINRQKAEIERLEAKIDKQYEQAEADILGNISDGGTSCHWCMDEHRKMAIKEFAERLTKKIFPIGYLCDGNYSVNAKAVKTVIDNLVKEMIGEQK